PQAVVTPALNMGIAGILADLDQLPYGLAHCVEVGTPILNPVKINRWASPAADIADALKYRRRVFARLAGLDERPSAELQPPASERCDGKRGGVATQSSDYAGFFNVTPGKLVCSK